MTGTNEETAACRRLREWGLPAYRPFQYQLADVGDVHGIEPCVGQVKSYRTISDGLRLGVDGAERQAATAGQPFGVAFLRRRGVSAGGWYAAMTVDTFARLLRRLRLAEDLLARVDPDGYAAVLEQTRADLSGTAE